MDIDPNDFQEYLEYISLMADAGIEEAMRENKTKIAGIFGLMKDNRYWKSFLQQMRKYDTPHIDSSSSSSS